MEQESEAVSKIERLNFVLPLDVAFQILARLDIENDVDLLVVGEIVGLDQDDLEYLTSCGYYKNIKFNLLRCNNNLCDLYAGGHKKRVKKYNILVRKLILRSPERFASLTAPYSTHKFLPESFSDNVTREPAFYYPIDEQSVEFWNRVHDTNKMLMRFKVANLWKQRESISGENRREPNVDDSISYLAFRMEHQFAKVLLLQNLHFEGKLK